MTEPFPTPKQVEIFCGTGGVGKTTLATSRAHFLAQKGFKVLLITIDPSHRLKEVLHLNEASAGEVEHVPEMDFDALLMNPEKTFARILKDQQINSSSPNRILKILTRPTGGMNEILSIVEVHHRLETANYQTIILDTPPGRHFIDFLNSSQKIKTFFDQSFVEIFKFLGQKVENSPLKTPRKVLNLMVGTGVKKLLHYLEKVTGGIFVQDFIDALNIIFNMKKPFLDALRLQENLASSKRSNWYLVTSLEQNKFKEAIDLQKEAKNFMHEETYVLLNFGLQVHLQNWDAPDSAPLLQELKSSLKIKESHLLHDARQAFSQVLIFPEILNQDPLKHIEGLLPYWQNHSS